MIKNILFDFSKRTELIILVMMVMVVIMLIIPLPTYLIDFLIALNLTTALLIFLSTFYISKILQFSTFPSVLLITTIFRLAISISTSRLILIQADAGRIITSFGQFVIGNNLIVGFVIFFIVTIVQFIVITKGSERIAEVAARFSLDAMPGKQMSIDADLKAGVIDEEELKKRRSDLETESQLYGALDGAMKFIKGDAIAGIVIIFVNFIGGIAVGMVQNNMSFSSALSVYTILTIGDALVAQIPALLISISGGLIVTRVNNDNDNNANNLGSKIIHDLFSNKFVIAVTAFLATLMGFLPGFPFAIFALLACALLGYYFYSVRKHNIKNKNSLGESDAKSQLENKQQKKKPVMIDGQFIPETVPLIIYSWSGHEDYFNQCDFLFELKKNFFIEYGVHLPSITLSYHEHLDKDRLTIAINEIDVDTYLFIPGMSKILMRGDELATINKKVHKVETKESISYWISDASCDAINKLGYYTRTANDEFYHCISTLLAHNITEFFGIQESKLLLDDFEVKYPDLLKECYRTNTIQRITEVFQRLVQEKISIRNMKLILEGLVQWSLKEKDPVMLVEHVRGILSRYISNRFSFQKRIRTFLFSQNIEEKIREGIRQTSNGSFINLSPPETEKILVSLENTMNTSGIDAKDIVLMVSVDIRRFVKKIIEMKYPDLEVLSFSEITPGTDIDVIASL